MGTFFKEHCVSTLELLQSLAGAPSEPALLPPCFVAVRLELAGLCEPGPRGVLAGPEKLLSPPVHTPLIPSFSVVGADDV